MPLKMLIKMRLKILTTMSAKMLAKMLSRKTQRILRGSWKTSFSRQSAPFSRQSLSFWRHSNGSSTKLYNNILEIDFMNTHKLNYDWISKQITFVDMLKNALYSVFVGRVLSVRVDWLFDNFGWEISVHSWQFLMDSRFLFVWFPAPVLDSGQCRVWTGILSDTHWNYPCPKLRPLSQVGRVSNSFRFLLVAWMHEKWCVFFLPCLSVPRLRKVLLEELWWSLMHWWSIGTLGQLGEKPRSVLGPIASGVSGMLLARPLVKVLRGIPNLNGSA